ncbi:MAG: hypothetical protein DRI90_18935 [Deltaproteobacteria bacterium]|nr:MAG: hypothetical protein DRI90_18935 [Deltaproteobacteria bacterium]
MLIAVPSDAPGGLDAVVSAHFGHCAAFTLVTVDDGKIGDVSTAEPPAHEQGGCMAPVMFLKQREVEALLSGGMGMRPLQGFQQVGIKVFHNEADGTVREAVQRYIDGKCDEFGEAQTCGGGSGGCGDDHHHEPVVRKPIEGKADVQKDRAITIDYKLNDTEGNLIDSSETSAPLTFLHGHGNIVPGLEKELIGLEIGAQVVVKVPTADAYGERDEAKIFDVPRSQLPPDVKLGDMLRAQMEGGALVSLIVAELTDEVGRLDPNHPLAGKDLVFDVTIVKIEQAAPEELEHGHCH